MATAVALRNDSVSKCIAFDPPGRYDTLLQNTFNSEQANKITTYEANGSLISGAVGLGVGNVVDLDVKENGGCIDHNHGIAQIIEALNTNIGGGSR